MWFGGLGGEEPGKWWVGGRVGVVEEGKFLAPASHEVESPGCDTYTHLVAVRLMT